MSSLKTQQSTKKVLHRQRGAATLIVTMVFLFSTSIVMLYLNRNVLFEQKTSANQMRSTQALEMAEAGIEWATGMLNTPNQIDTNCSLDPLVTANSFRHNYVQSLWDDATNPTTDVKPATTTYPGCKVTNGTWTCSCPVPTTPPATSVAVLGAESQSGFTLEFAETDDPEAVRVTAFGCVGHAGSCNKTDIASSDATAMVSVILKMRPLVRAAPASPLTCGTQCALSGSYSIVNTDLETGGILVNAGSDIVSGSGVNYTSIPGQPVDAAQVSYDDSLSDLSSQDATCENSAMFGAYFGSTIEEYAASPMTKTISCTSANDCGTKVDEAYENNWRSFYFPDGFARNTSSGSLGTATDPVTLVSASNFDLNGTIDIYGMIFSNSADVNDLGTGTAIIHGAMVTCADYENNGNGTLVYDAGVLRGVRRATSIFVRVPGSWIDIPQN